MIKQQSFLTISGTLPVTYALAFQKVRLPTMGIVYKELIKAACKRNEHVRLYIGNKHKIRGNMIMRKILDQLLNNSHAKQVKQSRQFYSGLVEVKIANPIRRLLQHVIYMIHVIRKKLLRTLRILKTWRTRTKISLLLNLF